MKTTVANIKSSKYTLYPCIKKMLADTYTPVSIYLRLRDQFRNCILLESSDYHGNENNFSYICFDPIASFKVQDNEVSISLPGESMITKPANEIPNQLQEFVDSFVHQPNEYKFITTGLFGYTTYDVINHFEDINVRVENNIPSVLYHLYRFIIVIDHFKEELYICEQSIDPGMPEGITKVESLLKNKTNPAFSFKTSGDEISDCSDDDYKKMVVKGKEHCHRGDVFQIVLSRKFEQGYTGDDFNVYRALRSINPSPYLFYFDCGDFRLFGSSPEAQLLIRDRKAEIHPIAGTFRRTGNDAADMELAEKLKNDPKENAEHTMLVDLARNDLSRNCNGVEVERYKEIQFYSHVIHLVSKVSGIIKEGISSIKIVADTFPAGTLSGAPKHKAMQLIDKNEKSARGFYGGCIGYFGLNGDFNHAIMIRSFMSRNNRLTYRAGAGVVESSVEENELNEVKNKLAALRKAIEVAVAIDK